MYISNMNIERKLYKRIEPYLEGTEAIIVCGMRRVGKTSLLQYISDKIDSSNKLMLDLENPLNRKYFEEENYEKIKSHFEMLGLDLSQKAYLFLDEIQHVSTLPSVVKYLIDHYKIKCFLTGSASFYLKNFFTESLAGRKYLFELFPLDFDEFLSFKKAKIKLPKFGDEMPEESLFDTIEPFLDEYLEWGGFPGVVLKNKVEEKKRALEDIFTSYYQGEVLMLGDFRRNDVIRDLILLLMQRVGSKLEVSKLSVELGVSRITLMEYLAFLEGTYLIYLVKPFSRNRDTEIRKTSKIYFCDTGMLRYHANLSEGALFENSIFQMLRMRGEVKYYQKKNGPEIDFILDKKTAFEVKLSVVPQDIAKLEKISSELGMERCAVISRKFPIGHVGKRCVQFPFSLNYAERKDGE